MIKNIYKSLLMVFLGLILFSCGTGEKEEIVNVYTHRHYDAVQKLFDMFTDATGIKVNVVSYSADELIQNLNWKGPTPRLMF